MRCYRTHVDLRPQIARHSARWNWGKYKLPIDVSASSAQKSVYIIPFAIFIGIISNPFYLSAFRTILPVHFIINVHIIIRICKLRFVPVPYPFI
jgi:hypothetical protein